MQREIEIKYLLSDKAEAEKLVKKLKVFYPKSEKTGSSVVISYFYVPTESKLQILDVAKTFLDDENLMLLEPLIQKSHTIDVRARSIDDTVYFVVKGAAEGDDPVHAVHRLEFEAVVDSPLEDLGRLIESAGIKIASKWSSKRDFYKLDDNVNMNCEFVSGYGYKAEIEVLINDDNSDDALKQINQVAEQLKLTETSQELFGRMYAYYNQHWQEYFNTNKVFPDDVWAKLGRQI